MVSLNIVQKNMSKVNHPVNVNQWLPNWWFN